MLYVTDEEGKPVKDQPESIMNMTNLDAEARFFKWVQFVLS